MKFMQIEKPCPTPRSLEDTANNPIVQTEQQEIETAILQHPGVKEVALLRHQEADHTFLIAYLVADLKADRIHWESECRVQTKEGTCVNLKTVDLSANGVGLRDVPLFFQTGQEVRCTLQLPTKGLIRDTAKVLPISVSFKGSIAWCNTETKRAGVLFKPTREQRYLLTQSVKLLSETQGIEIADLRREEPRVPLSSSCLVEFENGPILQLATENISPDGVRVLADQKNLWQVGQSVHLCLQLPIEGRVLPSFVSAEEAKASENESNASDQMVRETSLWLKGEVLWYYQERAGIRFTATAETKTLLQKTIEYITANQGYSLAHLRQYLVQTLPPELVPTTFVLVESLPRTTKGELDYNALPLSSQIRQQSKGYYVAPYSNLQWQLSKIWEYAFDMRPIGVKDNFFELGGDSLIAMRITREIKKLTHQSLPSLVLFNAPTVEQLAELLKNKHLLEAAMQKTVVPIQALGQQPPFFLLPALGGHHLLHFASITRHWSVEQPLYALPFNLEQQIETDIEEIAATKIKQIQAIQPTGPYFLGGYCAGAVIAYEMAQQLRAQKQEVAFLALIASDGPDALPSFEKSSAKEFQLYKEEKQDEEVSSLRERMQDLWQEQVWGNVWRVGYKLHQAAGRPLPHFLRDISQLNHELLKRYQPQPYTEPVTLFQPSQRLTDDSHTQATSWQAFGQNVTTQSIPGDAMTIWQEPNIQVFAERLRVCMQDVQGIT